MRKFTKSLKHTTSRMNDNTLCIVNLKKVRQQSNLWKKELPTIQPYYAIKCNPDRQILTYMSKMLNNNTFDCASQKEIETVVEITNEPQKIIFANPSKKISSLQYCNEIYDRMMMTFDSVDEMKKIKTYCPNAQLVLRILGDDSGSICQFNSKFGVSHLDCNLYFETAKELDLEIMGISFHVGSGCHNPNVYRTTLEYCKYVVDEAKKYDVNISLIDIGGGFIGSNKGLFKKIGKVIRKSLNDIDFTGIKFIGEPGRFMVETSHTLILNVINKKYNVGTETYTYYVSDGLYGSLNNIIYDKVTLKLEVPSKQKETRLFNSIVFGPTCDSLDRLGEFQLPNLFIGDKIIIKNMGAYTIAGAKDFN